MPQRLLATRSGVWNTMVSARYGLVVLTGITKKIPHLRGLRCVFVPLGASQCQTPNHSHSIIYSHKTMLNINDLQYGNQLMP